MKIGTPPTQHPSGRSSANVQSAQNVQSVQGVASEPLQPQERAASTTLPDGRGAVPGAKVKQAPVPGAGASQLAARRVAAPLGFEASFQRVLGKTAVDELVRGFTSEPVVLIAGQQCTGKGTVAPLIGAALAGSDAVVKGTGKLMREAAQAKGVTVEEFVKSVDADFDVELDYKAATLIGKGSVDVFESRLAGHLGGFMKKLGRKNLVSVYLVASPKEQALRYVAREVGPDARARVEGKLHVAADASLRDTLQALVALGDKPISDKLGPLVDKIAGRDETDRKRLLELYGVDYQDRTAFDVVVVTDGKTPAEVQAEIERRVRGLLDA